MAHHMTGKQISPMQLPDFARDAVNNGVALHMAIAEIEQLVRRCEPGQPVKLQPPGAAELVVIINAQGNTNGYVERLYWAVSPVTLEGVIEQVHTTLTVLVAEIRGTVPADVTPSAEVATNAIAFAVTGKRNKINVAATQAGSAITPTPSPEPERRHWLRIAGAVLGGPLTIAGVIFALMQAQGWTFG